MLYVERIELPDYDRLLGGRVVREQGDRIYVIEERDTPDGPKRRPAEQEDAATVGWQAGLLVLGWAVWAAVLWREYGPR